MNGTCALARSEAADWRVAAQELAQTLGPDLPPESLGVLYVTDTFAKDLGPLARALEQATGVECWTGTTGMGVLATECEWFDRPAAVALVLALDEGTYRPLPDIAASAGEIDPATRAWIGRQTPGLALVHADPRNTHVAEAIGQVAEETGAFLVGGLSSSSSAMPQLGPRGVSEGGVGGVMFAGSVAAATQLTQGASPIGPTRQVTRANRNVVLALDGRPALEVLLEDLGHPDPDELPTILATTHVALPIPGSDTGDYLVRNLTGIATDHGAVGIAAAPDPGDRIMFCRRDRAHAEADMRRMLHELKRRLDAPPKAGIYVSCLARGANLFGPGAVETGMIAEALGRFPLVGFFANGEISNDRLYGYTGVLTLFL